MKEAAKEKGVSIVLDIVGAVPVAGNAAATASRLVRAAYSINHVITNPAVGALSGTYGMYGGVTAGPQDPTDSFVGVASAGTGLGLVGADLALGGATMLPGIGNAISALTGLYDATKAYKIYQACVSHPGS